MNSIAFNHAGWEYFNWYWRRFDGRDSSDIYSPVHPDTLVDAAASLGFVDIEPLQAWVDLLKEPMTGMVSKIANGSSSSMTLAYDSMEELRYPDLHKIMLDSGAVFTTDAMFHALDDVYKLPTKSDVDTVVKNSPVKKMTWRAEREDCDDAAKMFKSWLGYLGYGNVAVGYVEMTLWSSDNVCTGAHAVNVIVYKDENGLPVAKFLEPQNLRLYNMNEVWVGGGINGTPVRSEIYWLEF
jgi:hypothetical protein